MELTAAITMTKEEALERVREYRGTVGVEDRLLARGYRALSKGDRLIDLRTVLGAGGQYEDGLPKLAAIRADARTCYVEVRRDGSVTFRDEPSSWVGNRSRHFLGVPMTFAARDREVDSWTNRLGAFVPPIPPRHRPRRGVLGDYTLLWEATWEKMPAPPGDPALLRRLSGQMYVVLATWDLTPLERAVLAGTRSA